MAMIRRELVTGNARDALVMDLGDIERRAEEVRGAAAAEAQRILAAARADADRIRRTAYEEAHAKGLAEGVARGMEQGTAQGTAQAVAEFAPAAERLAQAWAASLDSFDAQRDELVRAGKTEVVRLAAEIARRVVARMVRLDPSVVEDQLAEALRLATNASRLVVCVCPQDRPLAEAALPALLHRLGTSAHADIVPDERLTPGSVVVRTGAGGVVDASIPVKLDRIVEALLPAPVDIDEPSEGPA